MNDEDSCAHVREALGHQIHVLATGHLQQSLVPIWQLSFTVSFAESLQSRLQHCLYFVRSVVRIVVCSFVCNVSTHIHTRSQYAHSKFSPIIRTRRVRLLGRMSRSSRVRTLRMWLLSSITLEGGLESHARRIATEDTSERTSCCTMSSPFCVRLITWQIFGGKAGHVPERQ
jgi:hypothetical protein